MAKQSSAIVKRNASLAAYRNVTVIGAGAIGLSWTALFLANDLKVTVNGGKLDKRKIWQWAVGS